MALVLQPDSWMPPEEPQSQAPKRATLAEYFAQFANLPDPYLEYDNGYRSWSYTYAQVGAAARGFATRMQQHGIGGTLRLMGEPAEKVRGSKPVHAARGYYDGVDAVLSWHPFYMLPYSNTCRWDTHCGAYYGVI